MSDVKMAALKARGCALRRALSFIGGLAAMALLQLALLAAGPVGSARAQVTLTCSTGDTTGGNRFFLLDADAGTCVQSAVVPPDPVNGIRVVIAAGMADITFSSGRYVSSVEIANQFGDAWIITNYTGAIAQNNLAKIQVDDVIPDAAGTSTLSISRNFLGNPSTFTISGVTKTDGVASVTYGLVTVTYTPPPAATSPSAADKANIADHLLSSFNKVDDGIFGPGGIPLEIAGGNGGGAGFAFTPNGGGYAGSGLSFGAQGDTINPMDREFGFLSRGGGYAGLGKSASGKGVNFSFNLKNMISNRRKSDAQALGAGGGLKDGPYQPRSRWNAFAVGRYTDYDDDSTGADRDGHLWSLTSGLSYALGERTSVGAFTRVRKGEVESKAFNSTLDSDFFGGGVYLATTLGNGVRVMGGLLIEGGDNDITIAGDSGSFDTDQRTVEARLDKRFTRGKHWIEPALKFLYTDLDRDGYTDGSGAVIASGGTTLGRLTFGPTIGTTVHSGNATLKPFARINGVWDFRNESDFTLADGTVVSSSDTAIKLGGGLEVAFGNGVTMSAAGDWFSFNDDLDGVSVTGSIGVPLSVLGMGHAGSVSLNLASDGEDASAKARLRIPLGGK